MTTDTTTFQVQRARADVETIKTLVCDRFRITRAQLETPKRKEPIATIRQVAMVLCYEFTRSSLPDVAQSFGKRDHNTVRHAIKVLPGKASTDGALTLALIELRATIPQKIKGE